MGLKTRHITLIFLLACFKAHTQAHDVMPQPKLDYIAPITNKITARLFFTNTYNSFTINDRDSNLSIKMEPNKQNKIGASLSYRFITASFAFAPNFLAENKDNENSKLFNLNLRTYFGKWMQTLDVFNEKGFYLKHANTNVYFSNLKAFKIGGATSYIVNENLSFKAIVSQHEKQLKSAGSFIPRVLYYVTKYDIDDAPTATKLDMYSYDIAFAPSYYYNVVPFNNLLLSAGVSAGIGLNHTHSKSNGNKENLTSLLTEFNFRTSTSYNINNAYFGAHYSYLIINHNTDRSSYVNDNIPFLQVFLGIV